jgi:hypothetical protein
VRSRSSKENVFEQGSVFKRIVKGMGNEMSTVIWKIERSRDLSPESIRGMLKNCLESMDGAVEKVMNSVSDGMARKWRTWDKEEKECEERARSIEGRRDRDMRDGEERERKREERLKVLEEQIEKKASCEKIRKMGDYERKKGKYQEMQATKESRKEL